MIGITAIGAYLPIYRLAREEIGKMWRTKGAAGEKAVAGYDEDAVTMAVDAAADCLKANQKKIDGLYFATTTSPYREKQSAAIIASALDLDKRCLTAEFTNTLRAGTSALQVAADTAFSRSAGQVLVVTSDCRTGAPKGKFESILGDGAAALMIGTEDPLAVIEGHYSLYSEFTDTWRTNQDRFPQSGETRLISEEGYRPLMQEVVSEIMKEHQLSPGDFSKIVFYATDGREHAQLAKSLGFDQSQVQDPLFTKIGNAGTAATFIMLVAALEQAAPGDRILFVGYGDGCDAFILRATQKIAELRGHTTMSQRLSMTRPIDYGTYLHWRELVPVEPPNFPERNEPSLAVRWRERRTVSALYGSKCRQCGAPQIHPLGQKARVCVQCQSKDDFEPYKFSNKTGKIFTYAVDLLQPTKNPPGLNGVIDFDGGGRLICEMTDYDLRKVEVGLPVEMTFRKLSQGKGPINYYWKAKPLN